MGGAQPDGLEEETFANQLTKSSSYTQSERTEGQCPPPFPALVFSHDESSENNPRALKSLFLPHDHITPIKNQIAQREKESPSV